MTARYWLLVLLIWLTLFVSQIILLEWWRCHA